MSGPRTHFADPAAREMLLDEPQVCPWYPHLSLLGLAITPAERIYLVLNTPTTRFYAGPDTATLTRTTEIMRAALQRGRPHLDPDLGDGVALWVELCWDAALDEVVSTIAEPTLQAL